MSLATILKALCRNSANLGCMPRESKTFFLSRDNLPQIFRSEWVMATQKNLLSTFFAFKSVALVLRMRGVWAEH